MVLLLVQRLTKLRDMKLPTVDKTKGCYCSVRPGIYIDRLAPKVPKLSNLSNLGLPM